MNIIDKIEDWLDLEEDHLISVKHRGNSYLNVTISANNTSYSCNFKNIIIGKHTFKDGSSMDLPEGLNFENWLNAKIALLKKEKELILKEQDYVRANIDKIMAEQEDTT